MEKAIYDRARFCLWKLLSGTDCLRCKIHDFDVVDKLLSVNLATLSDVGGKERKRDVRVHISCICSVKSKCSPFYVIKISQIADFIFTRQQHYFSFYFCLYIMCINYNIIKYTLLVQIVNIVYRYVQYKCM